jgi:hypothetical protein
MDPRQPYAVAGDFYFSTHAVNLYFYFQQDPFRVPG